MKMNKKKILFRILFAGIAIPFAVLAKGRISQAAYKMIRQEQGVGAGVPEENYFLPEGFITPSGPCFSSQEGQISICLNDPAKEVQLSEEVFLLYPDTLEEEQMTANREHLQLVMDAVSEAGGGTVTVAEGVYYLNKSPKYMSYFNSPAPVYHCLYPRANVTLSGTVLSDGSLGTWFKPYGDYDGACNMFFYYNDDISGIYLENADFRDFGIDGNENHNLGEYNANGKGFMMTPIRDCDWYNVAVLHTDGTGFGVDETVNCTMECCTAIGCGKKAELTMVGGSGFGIGYGLSTEESMVITKCLALGNRKFGIFFESQRRFRPTVYPYLHVNGPLLAQDCISAGNLQNYGGEYCAGAEFADCISLTEIPEGFPNLLNSVTKEDYYFGTFSETNYVISEGVRTAADRGVLSSEEHGGNTIVRLTGYYTASEDHVFFRDLSSGAFFKAEKSKSGSFETVISGKNLDMIVYSSDKRRTLGFLKTGDPKAPFADVGSTDWFCSAVLYAGEKGYMTGYDPILFGPYDTLTRAQAAAILYRISGDKDNIGSGELIFKDVSSDAWYGPAVSWAKKRGIVSGYGNGYFGPGEPMTREQLAVVLRNYAAFCGEETNSMKYLLSSFEDYGRVSSFAESALNWCVNQGIINGKQADHGSRLLDPRGKVSRAECAVMIMNFQKRQF